MAMLSSKRARSNTLREAMSLDGVSTKGSGWDGFL